MAIDPHRDRAQMLKVESVQQAWQQWLNKLPPSAVRMTTCRRSAG
jgi:ATP-dependent helicase HrpA